MSFTKLLGECEAAFQLDTLCSGRRLPHAVIFESRDAELARKAAVELAAAFLCENEGKRPCGVCMVGWFLKLAVMFMR